MSVPASSRVASPPCDSPSAPPDLAALLQPSLQRSARRPAKRPFHTGAFVFVAFFGGIVPVTALFVIQARRLGVPRLAVELGIVGAAALAGITALGLGPVRLPVGAEIVHRAIALLYFLYASARLRPVDRAYGWMVSSKRAKSLVPALVATALGWAVTVAFAAAIWWGLSK